MKYVHCWLWWLDPRCHYLLSGQVIPCLEMVRRVTVSLNIGAMFTALEGGEGGVVRGLTDMKVSELRLLMRYCWCRPDNCADTEALILCYACAGLRRVGQIQGVGAVLEGSTIARAVTSLLQHLLGHRGHSSHCYSPTSVHSSPAADNSTTAVSPGGWWDNSPILIFYRVQCLCNDPAQGRGQPVMITIYHVYVE